jgi:hypothetical protein
MNERLSVHRPVSFSPEDAAMNGWLEDTRVYMDLEPSQNRPRTSRDGAKPASARDSRLDRV